MSNSYLLSRFIASSARGVRHLCGVALLLALGACSSTRVATPAPVEDRGSSVGRVQATQSAAPNAAASAVPTPAVLPGQENAGKPGYYTVRPGDSLIRIGLDTGQNWRDLARWNGIDNPNKIEVGQVLRVIAPTAGTPPVTVATPVAAPAAAAATSGAAVSAPVVSSGAVLGQPLPAAGAPAAPAASPAAAPAAKATEEALAFIWPTDGKVIAEFDGKKNNGIDIAGKLGQPVVAVADAQVLYVGAGIRGLGNLVILKHPNNYLSAYAHNQAIVVKENQMVKTGQKIAEMGSSDTDRVKLHFEIRKLGVAVDPLKSLPPR